MSAAGQSALAQCDPDDFSAEVSRFTPLAQAIHWLTALLMIAVIVIAWHMKMYPKSDESREAWYYTHESLGITILLLTVVRLAWRRVNPPPPPSGPLSAIEHAMAVASHWALYAILLAMPLSGYCIAAGTGHSLPYFFLVTIPPLLPSNPVLVHVAATVHALGQWIVYGLFGLHVLATAWHLTVRRDAILDRMLPAQRRSRELGLRSPR